ncbi:MAG TPA: sn-glycerol-1-phosphate dehydrogenase [Candidatus Acidoferrum sp.]|nr:sn-glycerol-1-phosphate dehydrogenase [Candidatus Acidoferrum sp.]
MPTPATAPSVSRALAAARDTRGLELDSGALQRTPEVFRRFFPGKPALVVADSTTFAVAGRRVHEALRASGCSCREPFIFTDPNLHAEHPFVLDLEAALKGTDAVLVAVGSGTINDLSKLASHRSGRRYLCVATAASMDGYAAFGASITYNGSKQTFSCPAPLAVVADLDIIAAAPLELTASGYADLLAKVPAGADWMIADALGAEPIHAEAWSIVQGGLREAVADPALLRQRDLGAVRRLIEGLLLGGFAMQAMQSSRPGSGSEHQFSHLWDMQHHTHQGKAPSHGFKVGIGTTAMTAFYERLLALPLHELDVEACCAIWPDQAGQERMIRATLGDGDLAGIALEETRAKWVDTAVLRRQLETLRRLWPDLRERLHAQLMPLAQIKAMLHDAGAPNEPEQIGITRQRLRDCFWPCYFLRRRFTSLDLAVRAGALDGITAQLFSDGGPWPVGAARGQAPRRG